MLKIEENWKNISTTVTLVKQVSYYYLYSKYYYLYLKYYDFYCNWMLKKTIIIQYYYSILLFVLILKIEGNCKKKKHITIIIIIIVTKKYLNKILLQASSVWLDAHPLGQRTPGTWTDGLRVGHTTRVCPRFRLLPPGALELVEALACRHLAQGLPRLGC